ncbi:MAG: putative toxin-antitoxin system toxin component, PIN family [Spirosomaceae bacterium]|nr:putative toxin-antitoxin system toxin component, PIN family [Spirosomataceae bacterium]
MKLVIDTNVLLVSISSYSRFHWLYRAIIEGKVTLFITNEIMSEYAEKLLEKLNTKTAFTTLRMLVELDNVVQTTIFYHFNLIQTDPDDNKFVDCAIAANADWLITNDKHFNILKDIDFPTVNVIRLEDSEQHFVKSLR